MPQKSVCQKTTQLFDSLKAGFYIANALGEVVYTNRERELTTGFSAAEIIGKKPGAVWGGYMDKLFYQYMWHTIRDKKEPFNAKMFNKKKTGENFQESLQIAPIFNDKKEIANFVGLTPGKAHESLHLQLNEEFNYLMTREELEPKDFVEWLIARFSEHDHGFEINDKTLVELLVENCILPTQNHFQYRQEDNTLIQSAQEDLQTFQILYEKYKGAIQNYFFHRLGDKFLVEDMTQETFMLAVKNLPKFEITNASYLTYLQRISHNLLVNHYRKKQEYGIEEAEKLPSDNFDLDKILDRQRMWQSVETLGENEKQALILKYKKGLKIEEISKILGKTTNAVKLILSRGRKKLKKHLILTDNG